MPRSNIPILTSLRFVAALLVVLHHYGPAHAYLPEGMTNFGYQAVTFFFVLSGFVLMYTYSAAPLRTDGPALKIDVRRFYLARLARLAPAYWIALALSAYFFYQLCFIADRISVSDFAAGLVLVPLFAQAWLPQLALNWNAPSWSLSVECFFYFVFPMVAVMLRRINPLITILACIAINHLVVELSRDLRRDMSSGEALDYWSNVFAYFPPLLLPQFVLGMALAQIHLSRLRPHTRICSAMAAAALVSIVLFQASLPNILAHIAHRDFLLVAFAVLILGAANSKGPAARLLSNKPFVVLGEASYALYIVHFPLLLWWDFFQVHSALTEISTALALASFFAVAMSLSLMLHFGIEIPARRYLTGKPSAKGSARTAKPRTRLHEAGAHARG